jgi:hypothetical protein
VTTLFAPLVLRYLFRGEPTDSTPAPMDTEAVERSSLG